MKVLPSGTELAQSRALPEGPIWSIYISYPRTDPDEEHSGWAPSSQPGPFSAKRIGLKVKKTSHHLKG